MPLIGNRADWWHVISGLLALPMLVYFDSCVSRETRLLMIVYSGLSCMVPVWLNIFNELRDEFHFWAWLPYRWDSEADMADIFRPLLTAIPTCWVYWYAKGF